MAERRKAPSNFSINPRLNLDTRHIQISRLLREAQGEEGYETATKYSVLVRSGAVHCVPKHGIQQLPHFLATHSLPVEFWDQIPD
ncbi:hypothetical protein HMH36_004453, partial [Salmonella enterica]|nr:hypothetical protein [Salmonella enterica]